MDHEVHRVKAFEKKGPFVLEVEFEDGSSQRVDFLPVLSGELYGPLHDPGMFDRVTLDPEAGTLVWPNDADFDPAILHDWREAGRALAELAATWRRAGVAR